MGEPTPEPRPRVDCTRYFDHLYFCYTPTWQLTQLYRRGELDSCEGAFKDWWDCLLNKAKPNVEVEVRREASWTHASASQRKSCAGARRSALVPCAVP